MSETSTGYPCSNHPAALTRQACSQCGRPFCDACLTELLGGMVCGWCRDQHVRTLQVPRNGTNPANIVLFARLYDGLGILMGGGFSLFTGFYASIVTRAITSGANGPPPGRAAIASTLGTGLLMSAGSFVVVLLLFLPPLLLLGKRRTGLWAWQLVALVAGLLGGCWWGMMGVMIALPTVYLIVQWCQPDVRAYLDQA